MGREENRAFVLETNEKLGVSRAQAEAMLAGSMFGWQTQAADPCSYDEQGRILTRSRDSKKNGAKPGKKMKAGDERRCR